LHSLAPGAVSGFQFLVSGFWFLETRSSSWLLVSGSRPGLDWLKGLDQPVQKAAHFPGAVNQLCDRFGIQKAQVSRYQNLGFQLDQRTSSLPEKLPKLSFRQSALPLGDVTGN
jgi:hypothetical protein